MNLQLNGKVAFVAGSSRGIGFAVARGFLAEGSSVCITGRNPVSLSHAHDSLSQAQDSLSQACPADKLTSLACDLTAPADIERALIHTVNTFGRIDVVIAGVGSGSGPAGWDTTDDDWHSSLGVNLVASVLLAQCALPHLIAAGGGSITFISSIAGCEAIPAPIAYSASKAALNSAMKNLSRLAAKDHVRINAVAPGNILFPGGTWERKLSERGDFFRQYIAAEVPLNRFGSPEEIADAVVFLSSPRSAFTTGACFVVDGGQTRFS